MSGYGTGAPQTTTPGTAQVVVVSTTPVQNQQHHAISTQTGFPSSWRLPLCGCCERLSLCCSFVWPCTMPCAYAALAGRLNWTPIPIFRNKSAHWNTLFIGVVCATCYLVGYILQSAGQVALAACLLRNMNQTADTEAQQQQYQRNCRVARLTVQGLNLFGMLGSMAMVMLVFLGCCLRGRARKQLNKQGSDIGDALLSFCCNTCSMTQLAHELDIENGCSAKNPGILPALSNTSAVITTTATVVQPDAVDAQKPIMAQENF